MDWQPTPTGESIASIALPPVQADETSNTDSSCSLPMNTDTYAVKYVPIGRRTPSPKEGIARRIAQDLKLPTAAAVLIAAAEMAALIDGPCWLVPVPASSGSLVANLALARSIAEFVPGARIKCAIGRAYPVESSSQRRLRNLPGLTMHEHAIVRTDGPIHLLPVYFIDNVITTGTTMAACRAALGWGIGLAYADASRSPHSRRFAPESTHVRIVFDHEHTSPD